MPLADELSRQGEWLFRHRSKWPAACALTLIGLHVIIDPVGAAADHGAVRLAAGLALATLGIAVRVHVVGCAPRRTSGRNTIKGQVADEVNRTGLYSVVRHPLYVGNFLMFLGPTLLLGSAWLTPLVALGFLVGYERIALAEESFLLAKFGERYREWALRTPAFLPDPRRWQPAAISFCWRTATKREYQGVALLAISFVVLHAVERCRLGHRVVVDVTTVASLAAISLCFLALRLLHKRTRLLKVEGR